MWFLFASRRSISFLPSGFNFTHNLPITPACHPRPWADLFLTHLNRHMRLFLTHPVRVPMVEWFYKLCAIIINGNIRFRSELWSRFIHLPCINGTLWHDGCVMCAWTIRSGRGNTTAAAQHKKSLFYWSTILVDFYNFTQQCRGKWKPSWKEKKSQSPTGSRTRTRERRLRWVIRWYRCDLRFDFWHTAMIHGGDCWWVIYF